MTRLQLLIAALFLAVAGSAAAFVYQAQIQWSSAKNQSVGGGALTLIDSAQVCSKDGSTWDQKATALFDDGSVAVANTGDLYVAGLGQITLQMAHTAHGAATAVVMSCQSRQASGTQWFPVVSVDSSGTSTERTWSHAVSAATGWEWNFEVNAEVLRCIFHCTSGNSSDRVKYNLRLAQLP